MASESSYHGVVLAEREPFEAGHSSLCLALPSVRYVGGAGVLDREPQSTGSFIFRRKGFHRGSACRWVSSGS